MSKIGFIGVGNMGAPMASNLVKAGHDVNAFDLSQFNMDFVASQGASISTSGAGTVKEAEIVITMLPAGRDVKDVYFSDVFDNVPKGSLLIDCSTIDVDTSRVIHKGAVERNLLMLDAPVSGGVSGAVAGALTMMVGGIDEVFNKAKPILDILGKNIIHCGGSGSGQAAKMCNNMMLGIQMSSVAEAFVLAESLGLDSQKLFDVSSTASGQCWSLTSYCPVPGIVPTSPSNNSYAAGFSTGLMLKDMNLAIDAAQKAGVDVSVAKGAAKIYYSYSESGGSRKDFSGIIEHIRMK